MKYQYDFSFNLNNSQKLVSVFLINKPFSCLFYSIHPYLVLYLYYSEICAYKIILFSLISLFNAITDFHKYVIRKWFNIFYNYFKDIPDLINAIHALLLFKLQMHFSLSESLNNKLYKGNLTTCFIKPKAITRAYDFILQISDIHFNYTESRWK